MREIISTGILGGVAFAALAVGVPRDADACNTIPPEEDCSVTVDEEDDVTYYTRLLQTVATAASPSQNCGCGQALGNLPAGDSVLAAGVFDLTGRSTSAFCGGGVNAQTTAAFQIALGGITWSNAVLNAVSTAGVPPGQIVYGIWKVHTPSGRLDGSAVGVAQVNFANGTATLDPDHQALANIDTSKCADCATNPFARACTATAAARSQLDATSLVAEVACARTDAVTLLGLTAEGESEGDGGCSSSGGRGPAVLLFGLAGVALAIGRARRRA
jgi:hypothetical protein